MRIGFWAVLCGFVVSISTTSSTLASCPDDAAAFAERVCGEISNRGSSQLITTSGELTAEAKGLVARMIGSAQGGANFNDTVQTYENVAREELAKDHANTRDCRAHMADVGVKQACKQATQDTKGAVSTGVYGAPGSATRGVAIDGSEFIGCQSGVENHGTMENILIRNSHFACPPSADSVPASVPSPQASAVPQTGLLGSTGLYNRPGAVTYDAFIENSTAVGCANGLGEIPSGGIRDNVTVICGPAQLRPPGLGAIPGDRDTETGH
jgi:hypothetical protein